MDDVKKAEMVASFFEKMYHDPMQDKLPDWIDQRWADEDAKCIPRISCPIIKGEVMKMGKHKSYGDDGVVVDDSGFGRPGLRGDGRAVQEGNRLRRRSDKDFVGGPYGGFAQEGAGYCVVPQTATYRGAASRLQDLLGGLEVKCRRCSAGDVGTSVCTSCGASGPRSGLHAAEPGGEVRGMASSSPIRLVRRHRPCLRLHASSAGDYSFGQKSSTSSPDSGLDPHMEKDEELLQAIGEVQYEDARRPYGPRHLQRLLGRPCHGVLEGCHRVPVGFDLGRCRERPREHRAVRG